jgi:hypothetical protein
VGGNLFIGNWSQQRPCYNLSKASVIFGKSFAAEWAQYKTCRRRVQQLEGSVIRAAMRSKPMMYHGAIAAESAEIKLEELIATNQ